MSALSIGILAPALLAALLILASHVPLGVIAMVRGTNLAGLALAQLALLGMALANMMWGTIGEWIGQFGGVVAALSGAVLITWIEKRFAGAREAIIGSAFAVAATLYFGVVSTGVGGADAVREAMIGRILWITPTQLLVMGVMWAFMMAIWHFRDLVREPLLFYCVLAMVVTASVQLAGIFPVFVSLIVPALATRFAPERWRLMMAFNVGALGYLVGLVTAVIFDFVVGAAIVCSLAAVAVLAIGLISRQARLAIAGGNTDAELRHDDIQARFSEPAVD